MRQQLLDLLDIQDDCCRRPLSIMLVFLSRFARFVRPPPFRGAILAQVWPACRHNPVRLRRLEPDAGPTVPQAGHRRRSWTWSAIPTCPPSTTKSPELAAAGNADLADDHAVPADLRVVPDLHQIIDLGAFADHRVAQRAAVDGGAGADLDPVLDDDAAELRNLDVARRRTTQSRSRAGRSARPAGSAHRRRYRHG